MVFELGSLDEGVDLTRFPLPKRENLSRKHLYPFPVKTLTPVERPNPVTVFPLSPTRSFHPRDASVCGRIDERSEKGFVTGWVSVELYTTTRPTASSSSWPVTRTSYGVGRYWRTRSATRLPLSCSTRASMPAGTSGGVRGLSPPDISFSLSR